MKRLATLAALAWMLTLVSYAPAQDKDGIEIIGLEMRKPLPRERQQMMLAFTRGTGFEMVITRKDQHILGVDRQGSKVTSCVDDKGTDLTKAPKDTFPVEWVGFGERIGPDGKVVVLQTRVAGVPATGASKITLKGTISLYCGKEEKSVEKKDMEIKAGAKFEVGPITIQPPQFGGGPNTSVSLTMDLPRLKSVKFFDADGKELTAFGSTTPGRIGFGEKVQYQYAWFFDKKHDKLTAKIVYFDKVEKVSVPLELSIGLGF
jgi:hypothetical protein